MAAVQLLAGVERALHVLETSGSNPERGIELHTALRMLVDKMTPLADAEDGDDEDEDEDDDEEDDEDDEEEPPSTGIISRTMKAVGDLLRPLKMRRLAY